MRIPVIVVDLVEPPATIDDNNTENGVSNSVEVQESKSKVDVIADKIIDAFTIKQANRFVECDQDVIPYEDSENRLIIMGSILAFVLNLTLTGLVLLGFVEKSVISMQPKLENSDSFPVPYLLVMTKLGQGDLVVLRQSKSLNFEIDWTFKVPSVTKDNSKGPFFSYLPYQNTENIETGFSVFEDLGRIFIVSSDTTKKMVMMNSNGKHQTLRNSELPTNHLYFNRYMRRVHVITYT